MPLQQVQYPGPGIQGLKLWTFAHADHHYFIALKAQLLITSLGVTGKELPVFIMDPVDLKNQADWGLRHQRMHDALNMLLGVNGTDLATVDFTNESLMPEWYSGNYTEHLAWDTVLQGVA